MAKGSASSALLGGLCGVLLALLAIFIGSTTARLGGGEETPHATHGDQ